MKIKYLPEDLSHIYVLDPFEKRYIKVPALDQAYTHGLTLWTHNILRRFAREEREKVNIEALAEAKRKIQAIVQNAKKHSRKGKARKKIARYDAATKKSKSTEPTAPVDLLPEWLADEEEALLQSDEWRIDTVNDI